MSNRAEWTRDLIIIALAVFFVPPAVDYAWTWWKLLFW